MCTNRIKINCNLLLCALFLGFICEVLYSVRRKIILVTNHVCKKPDSFTRFAIPHIIIFCSTKTLAEIKLIKNSQSHDSIKISLITETIIKEGSIELYGFLRKIEKIWFLELHKVQGVGAKMALKILSSFNIEELAQCLISGDIKSFLKISGINTNPLKRMVPTRGIEPRTY